MFKHISRVQKIVLTVFVPLIITVAALGIASTVSYNRPFHWEDTWLIWCAALIVITTVEYKLHSDKNLK